MRKANNTNLTHSINRFELRNVPSFQKYFLREVASTVQIDNAINHFSTSYPLLFGFAYFLPDKEQQADGKSLDGRVIYKYHNHFNGNREAVGKLRAYMELCQSRSKSGVKTHELAEELTKAANAYFTTVYEMLDAIPGLPKAGHGYRTAFWLKRYKELLEGT